MKFRLRHLGILAILGISTLTVIKSQNTTQLAITDSLRAKYWRARTELIIAEQAAFDARGKWLEVVKDISAACGLAAGQTELNLNDEGEPYCRVPTP